jgi:acyl carrier protein
MREGETVENLSRYRKVFMDVFSIADEDEVTKLKYQSHPNWDSLGHMALVAALESEFLISMDMDDVIDLESFTKGIEILAKYNVRIS